MGKEILTIGGIEIEKNKFYRHKTLFFFLERGDVDIEKVLVSNKIYFDEKSCKYFIGYFYNGNKVRPLPIMLPKTSAYVKSFDEQTKWIYFLFEDDDLLEKCNTIWDKFSADIKKQFDSDPVFNKEFSKTNRKSHVEEVTDFYNKKIPKIDSNHTCLAVINLNSALRQLLSESN